MELKKTEDCEHCGNCPVCGKPNNHYYHKHKPWTRFPCHPFFNGVLDDIQETKEENIGGVRMDKSTTSRGTL